MASVYASLSEQVLVSNLQNAEKELYILENTDPEAGKEADHRARIAFAKQNVQKLTDAIMAKSKQKAETTSANLESTFVQSNNEELKQDYRTIEGGIRPMPVFGPGIEVTTFLAKLKNIYAGVKLRGTTEVEWKFVNEAAMRMCDQYATDFTQHREVKPVSTFEEFSKFLESNYESKKCPMHLIQEPDAIVRRPAESLQDFGARVNQEMYKLKQTIKAKFVKQRQEVTGSKAEGMSADEVFDLMTSNVFLRAIKTDRALFDSLAPQLNKCLKIQDLVNHATNFEANRANKDPLIGAEPTANVVQAQKPSGKSCHFHRNHGYCKNDPCRFNHATKPAEQTWYKKSTKTEPPAQTSTQSDQPRRGGRGGRGRGGRGGRGSGNRGGRRDSSGGGAKAHVTEVDQNDEITSSYDYENFTANTVFHQGSN
ncbi:MAG: hypothetical protein CMO47_00650 [Verrucomicrobiales bacterium]|nr:hypothetical protein [Verrucomicrobiales bacterium]